MRTIDLDCMDPSQIEKWAIQIIPLARSFRRQQRPRETIAFCCSYCFTPAMHPTGCAVIYVVHCVKCLLSLCISVRMLFALYGARVLSCRRCGAILNVRSSCSLLRRCLHLVSRSLLSSRHIAICHFDIAINQPRNLRIYLSRYRRIGLVVFCVEDVSLQ